jgi:hypothetical protein
MPLTMKQSIRPLSLAGLLVLLAACSGASPGSPTHSAAATVSQTEPSPGTSTTLPSASSTPSSGPTAGVVSVTTASDAMGAVVAQYPQFAGYRMPVPLAAASASPGPPHRPIGGPDRTVLAERLAAGFRLIFVTGSGDCESGCTAHRYDVFIVHADGAVEAACVLDQFPVGRDPCAPG